jgi:hypothetical protein
MITVYLIFGGIVVIGILRILAPHFKKRPKSKDTL